MQKLITIYTESKPNIPDLVGRYFNSFTLAYTTGYWQGKPEKSVKIEIACDMPIGLIFLKLNHDTNVLLKLSDLITAILTINEQQAIMVLNSDNTVFFIDKHCTFDTLENNLR